MLLSKTMESAIEEHDLGKIYSSFYTILLADPGFITGKFDQTFNEVKSRNLEGFLQPYNGNAFKEECEWDSQYWDNIASELMDNFCIERINHLKDISKVIYSTESGQENKEEEEDATDTEKKTDLIQSMRYQQKSSIDMKHIMIALIAIVLIIMIVLKF